MRSSWLSHSANIVFLAVAVFKTTFSARFFYIFFFLPLVARVKGLFSESSYFQPWEAGTAIVLRLYRCHGGSEEEPVK